MITIRQSALNDYEVCPYKCYSGWGKFGDPNPVREEEDEISNKYAMAGTAFHLAMDEWGKHKLLRQPFFLEEAIEVMRAEYDKIPHRLFDSEQDMEDRWQSLLTQLHWTWRHHTSNSIVASEQSFVLEDLIPGLPPIEGTMDRLDATAGMFELYGIDYKTGKRFTKKDLKSNMQATIYSLAIERLYGKLPETFTFIFSRFQRLQVIQVTDEFLDAGVSRIRNIWGHILNEDFKPPIKPNKFFCNNFCEFKPVCPKWNNSPPGWEGVE